MGIETVTNKVGCTVLWGIETIRDEKTERTIVTILWIVITYDGNIYWLYISLDTVRILNHSMEITNNHIIHWQIQFHTIFRIHTYWSSWD